MIADLPPAHLLPVDLWPTQPILPSGSKSYFHWKYFGKLSLAFFTLQVVITKVLWHFHSCVSEWSAQKVCRRDQLNQSARSSFHSPARRCSWIPNAISRRVPSHLPWLSPKYSLGHPGGNKGLFLDVGAGVTHTKDFGVDGRYVQEKPTNTS